MDFDYFFIFYNSFAATLIILMKLFTQLNFDHTSLHLMFHASM